MLLPGDAGPLIGFGPRHGDLRTGVGHGVLPATCNTAAARQC
ncbi:hypothetical protein [Streptomyces sp. NPDC058371]